MKKIYKIMFFLIFSIFIGLYSQVNAQSYGVVDTRTFILDNGNDLGKIIPKGLYFTPRIPYTDNKAVAQQFLNGLDYPGDFYEKRNITADLVKGESKYFYIEWKRPYYISSLEGIKKVLKGYLFAYRKSGNIFWMDAQNFTPAFLTGYKSKEKQSIIIYPVRDRKTRKIKAFIQYPCGNLVCKDTLCTDLKVTPTCGDGVFNPEIGEQCDYNDYKTKRGCTETCTYKQLSCSISNSKEEILNTSRPYVKVKKDAYVDITKVYLNREEFSSTSALNRNKLDPGTYTLNAVAVNKYSGKKFLCDSSTFTVKGKEFCGDGIVNGTEQCDYKDPDNNGSCSTTCKFTRESCSISSNTYKLDGAKNFTDVISVRYPDTTQLVEIDVNGKAINPKTYVFNSNGTYNIVATIKNPYSGVKNTCDKKITYAEKEFCGDGIVNGYEKCDDGNTKNGDGCNSYCKYETPTCKIDKSTSRFNEGDNYKDYLKLVYNGDFNIAVVNDTNYFSSENTFLNTTIQANKCSSRNYLEYTVSNKLDPTLTKTCKLSYTVKNKEFCGDGIINGEEQCDINDPITSAFCNSSCNFKTPDQCHLLSNTLKQGEYGSLVIDSDYYSMPYKAIIDKKSFTAKNGVFKIKMNEPGTYTMNVIMQNKLDRKHLNDKLCEFNLVVEPDECKK